MQIVRFIFINSVHSLVGWCSVFASAADADAAAIVLSVIAKSQIEKWFMKVHLKRNKQHTIFYIYTYIWTTSDNHLDSQIKHFMIADRLFTGDTTVQIVNIFSYLCGFFFVVVYGCDYNNYYWSKWLVAYFAYATFVKFRCILREDSQVSVFV